MAIAERIPVYEPGPRPMPILLISEGVRLAVFIAWSTRTKLLTPRDWFSETDARTRKRSRSSYSRIAAERREEENSRAKRFIAQLALIFVESFDANDQARPRLRQIRGPAVEPFNDGDSVRDRDILVEPGGEELIGGFKTVEIEMAQAGFV